MRKILIFVLVLASLNGFSWGKTGHRIVGAIAEYHLSKKARKELQNIMGNESLPMASTWMDFIKSESLWDHANPWHYCTIPGDLSYEAAGTPEEGDAIVTINRLISELESKQFTDGDEQVAIRFLVHLIGDIHQPLHVGNGEDRGGNDVKVKWFWSDKNLHSVWDSGIIDGEQMSYTEWVEAINHPTESQVSSWQNATTLDWAYESREYRKQVYSLPENKSINYRYVYDNIDLVNLRLLQAGVRLAGVLNKIYG